MSSADYSTTEQIDQALSGQAWHIETIGPQHSETDPRWTHITTAWSVFVHPLLVHTYEVCQWSYARVYKTHTVRLCPDGRFTCTCPTGQTGFATSVRGYCNHINRLVIHYLRRDPTLPAPAREVCTLPWARTGTTARTQGRDRPTDGKGWPTMPVPASELTITAVGTRWHDNSGRRPPL